ncbi:hypothetical protein KI387_034492, partial [Taxus chinensis]
MAIWTKCFITVIIICHLNKRVESHSENEGFHCDSDDDAKIEAEYLPGIVTLDGKADEWDDDNITGYTFPLLPALNPDDHAKKYKGGQITLKVIFYYSYYLLLSSLLHFVFVFTVISFQALHDGHSVFFLLQVPGDYRYVQGKSNSCPSVALMFQVGEDATYHNMGGCNEEPGDCSSKSCGGYEVDMMHFSIGSAIPGRLYGANIIDNINHTGRDSFGHLVDMYAWNPHCRYLDGLGPEGNGSGNSSIAQNDWQGAWWHDSIDDSSGLLESASPYSSPNSDGTYTFEFSRPLRTMDRLQQ